MKKLILILFIITISFAQQKWIRTFGGTHADGGNSVQQTTDGGYIVAGYTFSYGAGYADVYLIKTDSLGDTLWNRTYGGIYGEDGNSVRQTRDGGYIVAGYTGSYGVGNNDVYLIKTNNQGDTLWTRAYGGMGWDDGSSVQQTSDEGYIVIGSTTSYGLGWDIFLVKTDANGAMLWIKNYGGTNDDYGSSILPTPEGGYIVAGFTSSFGAGGYDIYLIKTNNQGDTLWTRTYGGANDEYCCSVQQTLDGGYIVAGYTNSFGAGDYDIYLIKTDSSGGILWTRTYGGSQFEGEGVAQQTQDSGYIITGTTESFGAGYADVYLIKTDSLGDTLWARTYGGGADQDIGYSVQQAVDGGYIVTGYTASFGAGEFDVYLIKTDPNGIASVQERNIRVQSVDVRIQAVPNPFTSYARIPGYEKEDFALSDITGRLVGKYKGAKIGENLPTGVYFLISQNKNVRPLRIVKVR